MQPTIAKWPLGDPLPLNVTRGNIALSQRNAVSMMRLMDSAVHFGVDDSPTGCPLLITTAKSPNHCGTRTMKPVETE